MMITLEMIKMVTIVVFMLMGTITGIRMMMRKVNKTEVIMTMMMMMRKQ